MFKNYKGTQMAKWESHIWTRSYHILYLKSYTYIYVLEKREILYNPRPSSFILVRGLWHSDSEEEPRGAANAIVFSNVENKE